MSRRERERVSAARAARPDLYAEAAEAILASAADSRVTSLNESLLPTGRRLASEESRGLQPWGAPLRV